jgi:hypothetical protein
MEEIVEDAHIREMTNMIDTVEMTNMIEIIKTVEEEVEDEQKEEDNKEELRFTLLQ